MPDTNLEQISDSGKAPKQRIADVSSLNAVVRKLNEADYGSAVNRQDVQAAVDGQPPFEEQWMKDSGQQGRSNLNFGDLKRRVKREEVGYYDLTESVPMLGVVSGPMSSERIDPAMLYRWYMIMSEEFHKMLKDWASFDKRHQLLVQKFCTHGMGFIYFEDDINWKWRVAGMEDFKMPRGTTLDEDELDIAVCFRDVTVAQLFQWSEQAASDDTRWNRTEVNKAILKSYNQNLVYSLDDWEKWQQVLKNNDIYAVSTAQEHVKVATAWIREYSGQVSQYLTLRGGGNEDFLFKCPNRYDNINQCFNFFPYEVGTNGSLHSVRGLAHERFPMAQVLNSLRNQGVDNARLAGSLLLQPKSASDAEDLAVVFYGGVVYLPPEVQVQNGNLQNPSTGMLPVIQDMSLLLRDDSPNISRNSEGSQIEKTRFQVQKEAAEEAVLPAAALDLFYQPWKRHLNEVWRRFKRKGLRANDPGAKEILAARKRMEARGVPKEMITSEDTWIDPMRAVGAGSPGSRLMALEEFMQYYGQLDAVGQNNLLRDRFAQHVGYAQVDRYVPQIEATGRMPFDAEIADLQNAAMDAGSQGQKVNPNDNHQIHLSSHLPSLEEDLNTIETTPSNPQLVHVAVLKTQHSAQHMKLFKPDKLNGPIFKELTRKFNNLAQRTSAAVDRLERDQQKQQMLDQQNALKQAKAQGAAETQAKMQPQLEKAKMSADTMQANMRLKEASHQQDMRHKEDEHKQEMAMTDTEFANKLKLNALPTPTTPEVAA